MNSLLQVYRYSYTASYIVYNVYTRWASFLVMFGLSDSETRWWLFIFMCMHVCICVYQGGLGAEPTGGSQRSAPTCSLGKTRTTAGKAECVMIHCFTIFLWIHAASSVRRDFIHTMMFLYFFALFTSTPSRVSMFFCVCLSQPLT